MSLNRSRLKEIVVPAESKKYEKRKIGGNQFCLVL